RGSNASMPCKNDRAGDWIGEIDRKRQGGVGHPLTLAAGAVKGGPGALDEAPDRRAAAARFALAPVDREVVLVATALPVRVDVVAEGGSPTLDGAEEHGTDRGVEPRGAHRADTVRAPPGRDAGHVERLAGVDVAEPGDAPLIEQELLDIPSTSCELGDQP